jgi:hypothetical protein
MKLERKVLLAASSFGFVRWHLGIILLLLLCTQPCLAITREVRSVHRQTAAEAGKQEPTVQPRYELRPVPSRRGDGRHLARLGVEFGDVDSFGSVGGVVGSVEAYKVGFNDGPSETEAFDILRQFYFALGGITWLRADGWLQPTVPICDWWGVTCLPRNYSKEFTPIVRLELPENLLRGALPPCLARLSTLQVLDLSENAIHGMIPKEIGNFSHLVELRLSQNNLIGEIPDSICETYSTLQFLDLGGNQLTSPIPDTFYYLSRLQFLNLSYNLFQENIPDDISQLTSLSTLLLSGNAFYGSLPRGFTSLSNLKELDISHNRFSGEIATELTVSMTGLQVFIASHNNFTGSTWGLGYLINIRKLLVNHNALTGELHPYLYQLRECIAMDLSRNQLDGYVAESLLLNLLTQTQLIYLNLMSNPGLVSWEQRIPSFLGQDPHSTNHGGIGSFVCHRLFKRSSPSTTLMVDPSFFSYAHCNCIRDSYGQPPDQCYDCPPGAYCSGSTSFTFDSGWYPVIAPANYNLSQHPNGLPWINPQEIEQYPHQYPRQESSSLAEIPTMKHKHTARSEPYQGQPKGYLQGPVLLYPCPDLSSNASSCNPHSDSKFEYNSSTSYGMANNQTLCEKGYDLRLCSFCTCAAATNPACTSSSPSLRSNLGGGLIAGPGDCSCYYRSALKCVPCKKVWQFQSTVALAVSLWIIFILLMAFVFYMRKAPLEATPLKFAWIAKLRAKMPSEIRHSGYLKILVVYLQTLSVVSKDPILRYFKLMTGDIFSFGAICAWPLLSDPFWQHLFYLILPAALLLGLLISLLLAALASSVALRMTANNQVQEEDFVNDHLIYGGGSGSNFDSKPADVPSEPEYSLVAQGISVVLIVQWWFLFGVAYRALSVFNCASDPLSSFLETQPWLGCHSPEWKSLKLLSIVGIVVYLAIVPFVFALLLFLFRKKVNEPFLSTALEILCASYRSGAFWYEIIAMARRIGLAAGLALLPGNSAFKMSTICLLLVVGLYAQIVFRPFRTKFENVMEELSMVTILLTYAGQYGFNIHFAQMATLNIITIVVNFLLLASILYTYISRTYFPQFRFLPWSKKPSEDEAGSSLASIAPSVRRNHPRTN